MNARRAQAPRPTYNLAGYPPAVRDGYISVTPLQPDMTAYDALQYVEDLPLTTADVS